MILRSEELLEDRRSTAQKQLHPPLLYCGGSRSLSSSGDNKTCTNKTNGQTQPVLSDRILMLAHTCRIKCLIKLKHFLNVSK